VTSPARPARAIATLAVAAALVAACAGHGGPTSSPRPTGPVGSGATACATAPQPPDNLEGWGPPAIAPTVVPYLITSAGELACGANRVLFTILDKSGTPIGAPDRTARVSLFDLGRDPSKAIATAEGTFIWAIEDVRGIYVINVTFPEAGVYGMEVTTAAGGGAPVTERLTFDVQPSSPVIKVGDRAPVSKTPTLAGVGGDVTKLSTDQHPEPAFYRTSVDQAIADHKPFVLIFATPKFCTSAQCGPTLDRIKPYLTRYPGVTFINVEPYELKLVDGVLTAVLDSQNAPVATAVTDEWHLFSEPNVFVVDREGIVRANFELIFSDAELTAALDAVK
jgi:hypothetical protein